MIFLNPWGFLALLGIPIVIYIHMLQRRSKRIPVSTLFLLNVVASEKKAGKKIEKLKNSLLLWLNIIAILLLTCLIIQPRTIQSRKILKAIVVVDASSSMQPFIKDGVKTLLENLRRLNKNASGLELTIMSSILEEKTIYSGGDLVAAEQKLTEYKPAYPAHDLDPALRRAQSILNSEGLIVLLSDTPRVMPVGVLQILSGRPIENIGFTGFIANDQGQWQATLRNYSEKKVSLEWRAGSRKSEDLFKHSIEIEPRALKTISGVFFEGDNSLVLKINDDEFSLDNKICAIRPLKKELHVNFGKLKIETNAYFHKFLSSIHRVKIVENGGDFTISPVTIDIPADKPGIYWVESADKLKPIAGGAIAMANELMEGLVWEGFDLNYSTNEEIEKLTGFSPLLKHEDKSLISCRETGKGLQILFKMDLNANSLQSSTTILVLLYRCLEQVRQQKKSYYQQNFECNNTFNDTSLASLDFEVEGVKKIGLGQYKVSSETGFFSIKEKKITGESVILMEGAAHFADASEADFSKAQTLNELDKTQVNMTEVLRENDFLKPLWLLLLITCCCYGWLLFDKREVEKNKVLNI